MNRLGTQHAKDFTMRKSFRMRFTFWLDLNKSDESELADIVDTLKSQRGYASAIRDGLRMVWELRQGRVDTLVKLFPWVAERFQPQTDTTELSSLVEQFRAMMTNTHSTNLAEIPAWNIPSDNKPEVRIIQNDDERKKLSVKNTLAALDDF